MLLISSDQVSRLDESYFLNKLADFLSERSANIELRSFLNNRPSLYEFWHLHYQEAKSESEFAVAIYLTYVLSCRALSKKAEGRIVKRIGLPEVQFGMRRNLEDWGVIRFSEFDI